MQGRYEELTVPNQLDRYVSWHPEPEAMATMSVFSLT